MTEKTVLIESKIRRKGGSRVALGGVEYHFIPRPEMDAPVAHVCPVSNKAHIKRFLEITEGYRLFLGEDEDADMGAIAAAVPDDPPASEDADADEGDDGDDTPAAEDAGGAGDGGPLESMSDEDLHARFKAINGRAAPKSIARDKLIAKIIELEAQD